MHQMLPDNRSLFQRMLPGLTLMFAVPHDRGGFAGSDADDDGHFLLRVPRREAD